MGHKEVPYQVIRELVKELQPNCLLSDHAHLRCLYDVDTIFFEAGSPCPEDNTLPSALSALINSGGNGWFWAPDVPAAPLMSTADIVNNLDYVEPRWCAFLLNCPPNNQGRLDTNIVGRLSEAGQAWSPDYSRPALSAVHPQNEHPITPYSAVATSGTALYAIGASTRASVPGEDPSVTPTPETTPADNLGDANNDRVIDIIDALVVAQYYVGLASSPFDQTNADVNCDGNIDIVDALLIAQYYVGLITGFC